jgi:hypothetical protein
MIMTARPLHVGSRNSGFVDHHVPTLGAEGHSHCVGEQVDTAQAALAGFRCEADFSIERTVAARLSCLERRWHAERTGALECGGF